MEIRIDGELLDYIPQDISYQAVVALGKRMIELMKIPIVALIALIAAVLMKLKKELPA